MSHQSKIKSLLGISFTLLAFSAADADEERPHHRPPEMTDAQKKCFTDQGLEAPGSGKRPSARPDRSVMEKVHACLKENGLNPPANHPK